MQEFSHILQNKKKSSCGIDGINYQIIYQLPGSINYLIKFYNKLFEKIIETSLNWEET